MLAAQHYRQAATLQAVRKDGFTAARVADLLHGDPYAADGELKN